MKKKVLLSIIVFVLLFIVIGNVGAEEATKSAINSEGITACNTVINESVIIDQKIPDTISLIIKIIRVAVPILLVIFGSLDLVKGIIAGKDDEIKKGQQIFIKRLIAGALVFFVFVIVEFVVSLAAGSTETNIMKCAKCFITGEEEDCNPVE